MVFSDLTRTWRDFAVGDELGQSAANHDSITSANDASFSRRGPGSTDWARSATS